MIIKQKQLRDELPNILADLKSENSLSYIERYNDVQGILLAQGTDYFQLLEDLDQFLEPKHLELINQYMLGVIGNVNLYRQLPESLDTTVADKIIESKTEMGAVIITSFLRALNTSLASLLYQPVDLSKSLMDNINRFIPAMIYDILNDEELIKSDDKLQKSVEQTLKKIFRE